MPPQPLSHFNKYYTYSMGDGTMAQRPGLALAIANVMASTSLVEVELAQVMCEAMKASAKPFAAAFEALSNSSAQIDVAASAVLASVSAERAELFEAILILLRRAKKDRDKIAHAIWAWSEQLPEKLLWIDPKTVVRTGARTMEHWEITGRTRTAAHPDAGIPEDAIFIYSKKDFEEMSARSNAVKQHLVRFGQMLWVEQPEDDELLRQLSSEPDIQEALAHLRKHHPKKK